MPDELNLRIVESADSHSRRIGFQVQSGDAFNQSHIESFGSLCIVHGRMIVKLDNSSSAIGRTVVFECALESGEQIARKDYFHDIPEEKIPSYIQAKSLTIIKASRFNASCPIEAITLEIISGSYIGEEADSFPSPTQSLVIFQSSIKFKSYDTIYPSLSEAGSPHERWVVQEILFDYMTLFTASVTLPRSYARRSLGYNVTPSQSNAKVHATSLEARFGYDAPVAPISPSFLPRESLPMKIARVLMKRRWMVEVFCLVSILALWFIFVPVPVIISQKWVIFTWNRSFMAIFVTAIAIILLLRWRFPTTSEFRTGRDAIATNAAFNGRSLFVNGWQSWSFCGSVLHGEKPPMYSMPSLFVRAFHDGGVGTALPINLGGGKIPFRVNMSRASNGNRTMEGQHPTTSLWSGLLTPGGLKKKTFFANTSTSSEFDQMNIDEYANKDYIASDMFTLLSDLRSQYGIMLGFLTQHQQFGCIATNRHYDRLTVHVSGDGVLIPDSAHAMVMTDPLVMYVTDTLENPFQTYMRVSSRANQVDTFFQTLSTATSSSFSSAQNAYNSTNVDPNTPNSDSNSSSRAIAIDRVPVGWCSWYHFYEKISETSLLNNLKRMQYHQQHTTRFLHLFQIDDGYQQHWGDWLEIHPRFSASRSLANTVTELSQAGFLSGLWLSPFAADKNANIIKQFPRWILRKAQDLHASACNSANCGKFFYGLDVTNPTFQEYLKEYLHTITQEWGFRYLKLDFLYAAVLKDANQSYFDRTLTKAQIMQLGMHLIRDNVNMGPTAASRNNGYQTNRDKGNVFLLGCGAPLGSVIGHVHANRISADMGSSWNPDFPLPAQDTWNLPCARNAVRNTLTRMFMHRHWWINDPDCLLLRDSLHFTEAELIGIATVKALSGGSLILSDDLDHVSSRRLRIAQKLLPPTDQAAVALDVCYRETPELLRMTLQSNHTKRLFSSSSSTNNVRSGANTGTMTRATSDSMYYDGDYHFHIAMTPSNDEFFPWDAGMSNNLYECFQHEYHPQKQAGLTSHAEESWSDSSSSVADSSVPPSPYDSGNDSPARRHPKSLATNLFGSKEVSSPTTHPAKSLSQSTAAVKHSPFLLAAHRHHSEKEQMIQIRHKYLDKRDLLKRWYVFAACFWTEQTDIKHSEQRAANLDLMVSHAQFYHDVAPKYRRTQRRTDGDVSWVHPHQEETHDRHQKPFHIHVQSSRAAKHSMQQRNRQAYFLQHLSNSAFYDGDSTKKTWFQRMFASSNHNSKTARTQQPFKTHFVHLRDLFGAEDLQEMIAYTRYLYRHQLKRRELHIEKSYQHIQRTLSSSDFHFSSQKARPTNNTDNNKNKNNSNHKQSLHHNYHGDNLSDSDTEDVRAYNAEDDAELTPTVKVDSFDDSFLPPSSPPSHHTPATQQQGLTPESQSAYASPFTAHHPTSSINNREDKRRPNALDLPPVSQGLLHTPQTPHVMALGISHVLHMFNFWEEKYTYKVIALDDDEGGGEVAFPDIPLHSASLYSLHISLHPLIPKYLGSNLHFTGGLEIHQAYLLDAPIELKRALEAMCHATTQDHKQKKSRSNVFASPSSSSVFHKHHLPNDGPSQPFWDRYPLQTSSSDSDTGGGGNAFFVPVAGTHQSTPNGVLHAQTPKIQCMRIDFEDGVLKESAWGGFVWVFLPVNIHQTRHFPHLLGRVQVMGDALNTGDTGAEGHREDIEIVDYVDEMSCLTAGYVYKIPVSLPVHSPNDSHKNNNSHNASTNHVNNVSYNVRGGSSSCSSASESSKLRLDVPPPSKPSHHVIVAWICDIVENQ